MTERPARPLKGWLDWAARHPADVSIDPAEPVLLDWTPDVAARVAGVNDAVNAAIGCRPDAEAGWLDRWERPSSGRGDCEDYCLEKRARLVAAGFPRRPFRIAVVLLPSGEGHAVLLARTRSGPFVLDNLRGAILPLAAAGYRFVRRERSLPPAGWTLDP